MILYALVLGLGAATVAICTLLDKFYDVFARWLKTLPEKLKKATPGILVGCKTLVNATKHVINGTMGLLTNNYSKVGEQWVVTSAQQDVFMDEFPEEILNKTQQAQNQTADVTEELKLWMGV